MNAQKDFMTYKYNIRIIKTKRKTVSLTIEDDGNVTVRAPLYMSRPEIERLLKDKSGWIEKHLCRIKERQQLMSSEETGGTLCAQELKELADRAASYIPERVKFYADIAGVAYGRITIRNQRTRWGSCSGKGNLNFNCLLMLMPPEIIDYVVVHELCHRKEMNHSKAFWTEVEKVLPDYEKRRKWLKDNGNDIMRRMK